MTATPTAPNERLLSLDVYRGLIMISLAFNGFGLATTAQNHLKSQPDNGFWKIIYDQFEHAQWCGISYWDMIQPSFMFMVGVSMAYSYVKRRALGHSWLGMFSHAATRAIVLILLGIFLISNGSKHTEYSFMNVLTQIGLGYTFLFLMWGRPAWLQAIAVIAILVGTHFLYVSYPHAGVNPETGSPHLGVTKEFAERYLNHIDPHYHKGANVGHAIDLKVLNAIPHPQEYKFNRGGYQTINFLPSLATMILGLMCGELLRSPRNARQKLFIIIGTGVAGIAIGTTLHYLGCPLVKRIWTPSWALTSTGVCLLILGSLYGLVDMKNVKFWTFPIVVVGMNSIAIYCMSMLLKNWTARTIKTHTDGLMQYWFKTDIFGWLGSDFQPMLQSCLVGMCFWTACFWMYRNRIFVRI